MTFANTNVLIVLLQGLNSFLTNVMALETKKIIILVSWHRQITTNLKIKPDNEFLILKVWSFYYEH